MVSERGRFMAVSKSERVVLENEVRSIYEAYQHRKASIERVIRERVEREIAAEQGDALRDLSKALHDYYRRGLPKSALRVATKKYGNNDEFLKLWNAYQPEDEFSMAVGRTTLPVFEWRDKVLYIHRNPATSEVLPHTVAAPLYSAKGWFMGGYSKELPEGLRRMLGDYKTQLRFELDVDAEIKRAAEAGEFTESTNPFDYVNELPEDEREAYLEAEESKNVTYNPWIKEV